MRTKAELDAYRVGAHHITKSVSAVVGEYPSDLIPTALVLAILQQTFDAVAELCANEYDGAPD